MTLSLNAQEMHLDPKASPELHLDTFAEVTGAWATLDSAVAAAVEDLHIGTTAFLDNRLKWRKGQALTVLEVRAWRLAKPFVTVPKQEHFGCFSWGEDQAGRGAFATCFCFVPFLGTEIALEVRFSPLTC